jgi:hypothetical protein
MKQKALKTLAVLLAAVGMSSCNNDDNSVMTQTSTISVESVLDSRPLVQSGTFKGQITPTIASGESVSITFSASKNQRLTFATMYGWSNDLFFAPENPGIKLYSDDGTPITGDVSAQLKLWDNGTRVNVKPGHDITHPGVAEGAAKNIKEVVGVDDFGNTYPAASAMVKLTLTYNNNSQFTLKIENTSGQTDNETLLSPGVWAISYFAGSLLLPEPIYSADKPTANGLTNIAEAGDNAPMSAYLTGLTGIFTPLSPVLVVVYDGDENPYFKIGENDRNEGLKDIAQKGKADTLAAALMTKAGVKAVYILKDPNTTVLLPKTGATAGSKVSQQLTISSGDRIAVATMYGFSNDWFFSTSGNDIDATQKGDVTSSIQLYDDGTAINQYPGAGITQFNLAGTPLAESKAIQAVSNPNEFTTLPAIGNIIKVTLE